MDTGLGAGEQPTVTIKRNTAKPIRTEYKKAIGIASRGMVAQQSDTLTSANPLRAWLMHMPTRIGQNVNFGGSSQKAVGDGAGFRTALVM